MSKRSPTQSTLLCITSQRCSAFSITACLCIRFHLRLSREPGPSAQCSSQSTMPRLSHQWTRVEVSGQGDHGDDLTRDHSWECPGTDNQLGFRERNSGECRRTYAAEIRGQWTKGNRQEGKMRRGWRGLLSPHHVA